MTQTMADLFGLVICGVSLLFSVFWRVTELLDSRQPVSADARRLRAALRKEAPLKGRVDRFPRGRGLTRDMKREIGAAEGFRFDVTRKHQFFEYIGRSREDLPDA